MILSLIKSWALSLIVFTALCAAITALAWTGHLTGANAFAAYLALAGLVGGTGFLVLLMASVANPTLVVHTIAILELAGAIFALVIHNVFTGDTFFQFFSLLVTA